MKATIFVCLCLALILSGCSENRTSGLPLAKAIENIPNGKNNFIEDIRIIPLETNDSSVLGRNSHIVYADEENFIICADMRIFRFSSDGKFLNTIGSRGNGPFEYTTLMGCGGMRGSNDVFILAGNNRIVFFHYDGTPKKEIILQYDGKIKSAMAYDDKIICEGRKYGKNGELNISILVFSLDGKLLSKYLSRSYEAMRVTYQSTPVMYSKAGDVIYKNPYSEESYICLQDTFQSYIHYDTGKYRMDRESLENFEKRIDSNHPVMDIVDIQEDSELLYALIVLQQQLYGVVVNTSTNQILFADHIQMPQKGGGIKVPGYEALCVWPTYIDSKDKKYCIAEIIDNEDVVQDNFNFVLQEDSNPVVVTYK